jgi:hypothetical protein
MTIGACLLNDPCMQDGTFRPVLSDQKVEPAEKAGVDIPFGGTGKSGFGREKGLEALRGYCRVKSVVARI